ncbi:carbon storage regulator, CsrA [Halopseudomonas litoralis]|uniref:Translational regulator CsrA n=1 Tax=Halopseudomonas litoralis TaxID=797277 RepID=A0A1H1QNL9_9GAMM|nr:carbon storage regulator [Halopseudomonas litoralis]SDS24966.1 carbon storage regulator, CsrA [Halopseudomonas litoralis]
MLSLTRRTGETLIITAGEHTIELTVLAINGRQVRIGTEAPQAVRIVRKEIAGRYPAHQPA